MNEKNTIKDLINLMEETGESKDYIIGWLSSMINYFAPGKDQTYTLQDEIDSGVRVYRDKAMKAGRMANLQKTCNEATVEELYA